MDAFSQILSGVKLNGAVFFRAEFSAPWGFSTPTAKAMTATHAPGAEHLVLYHLVIQGGAFIELLDGQSPRTQSRRCRRFFRMVILTT